MADRSLKTMLGYLFIVIAVLGTSVKGYVGKHTSAFTETPAAAVGFSTVRMLLVFVVGAAVVLAEGDLASITLDSRTLFLSAVSGIANSLLVVSWLFCVRSGAYMMVDAVQTAAIILLPTLTGAFFFSAAGASAFFAGAASFFAILISPLMNASISDISFSESIPVMIISASS